MDVKVDSYGVHFALTDDFKTAVNTTLPNRIKAIEDDYLTSSDKTSLEGKVSSALTEAKEYTDEKVGDVVNAANSELKGEEGDASSKITVYGTRTYAEEKAAAAQSAAETTAAADATSKVNAAKEELQGNIDSLEDRVEENEAAIATLNGSGEGSVDAKITAAFDDFASKVSDDGVVNTYKELIDYAAEHGAEFTELVGTVANNKTAADTGIQEAKEAASAADEKAAAAQSAAEAAQAAADANADAIAAMDLAEVSGYITKVSQVDGKLSAEKVDAIPASDVTVADSAGNFSSSNKNVENALEELAEMWEWEEL